MFILTLFLLIVSIALLAYKKVRDLRSNLPSPGLFWFFKRNHHTGQELLEFVEKKRCGLVHAFFTNRVIRKPPFYGIKSHAIITHPDVAQIILRDEETFVKDADSFGEAGALLTESLICYNGSKFKQIKDILAPVFHYNNTKTFAPLFATKSDALFDCWAEKGGKNMSIHGEMGHFTLDCLGITAFNIDFKTIIGESHQYLEPYKYLMDPDPYQKRTAEKMLVVHEEISKNTDMIVKSKKEATIDTTNMDYLDRLLQNSELTKEQIRDNTFMMFLAGHETTANALTWALYHFAKYPEMQKVARDEVDTMLNGQIPDADNVKSLTYLDMFIKESMRIKPTVSGLITRITAKDAQVGEYFIPKGTSVGISMYVIHHLKEFWPDPEKFDPLRFSPERSEGRHPFAYLPFSLGRRMCIGHHFSILEQKIFLARTLQRVTLSVNEKCNAETIPYWLVCRPTNLILDATPRADYKA